MDISLDISFEVKSPYGKDINSDKEMLIKSYITKAKIEEVQISNGDIELIKKAFDFCVEAHENQFRKTGDPYYTHPLSVAKYLIDIFEIFDSTTIASALLHDTVEDNDKITTETIKQNFGETISKIVDGLTKIKGRNLRNLSIIESIIKLLGAAIDDLRIIIIKLADRYHNLRSLKVHSADKQKQVAEETRYFYVPLAHLLGLNDFRRELQNYSYYFENPNDFLLLQTKVQERKDKYLSNIKSAITFIKEKILNKHIDCTNIIFLHKPTFEIYAKINKLAQNNPGVKFDQIIDNLSISDMFTIYVEVNAENTEEKTDIIQGALQRYYNTEHNYEIRTFESNITRRQKSPTLNKFIDLEYEFTISIDNNVYEVIVTPQKKSNFITEFKKMQKDTSMHKHIYINESKETMLIFKNCISNIIYDKLSENDHQEEILNELIKKIWKIIEINLTNDIIVCQAYEKNRGKKKKIYLPKGANGIDLAYAFSPETAKKLISLKVTNRDENLIEAVKNVNYKICSNDNIELIYGNNINITEDWHNSVVTFRAIAHTYFDLKELKNKDDLSINLPKNNIHKYLYVRVDEIYSHSNGDKPIIQKLIEIINNDYIKKITISIENSFKSYLFELHLPDNATSNIVLTKVSVLPEVVSCQYISIDKDLDNYLINLEMVNAE